MARPIERLIPRFVDSWQISQPLHLRHLALIRDTKIQMRNGYYVHYTYGNFAKLVERGTTPWEAVAAVESNRKKNKTKIPPPGAQAVIDRYGFPKVSTNQFYGSENDATLLSCVQGTVAQPLLLRNILATGTERVRDVDGEMGYGRGNISTIDSRDGNILRAQSNTEVGALIPKTRRTRMKSGGDFVSNNMIEKVALPPNFSHMNLQARNKLKGSQLAAIRYACGKAEKAIKLRVESGVKPEAARVFVYAEVDAQHQGLGHLPPSEAMKAFLSGQYDDWRSQHEEKAKRQARMNKRTTEKPTSPMQYLPSIYAHTQRLLTSTAVVSEQREPGFKNRIAITAPSLPSVDVQTASPDAAEETSQPTPRTSTQPIHRRGLGAKTRRVVPYLPSIIAHSRPFLDPASFRNRRQRKSQLPSHLANSVVLPHNGSAVPTTTVATKRKREASVQLQPNKKKSVREKAISFYERLSCSIQKPGTPGVCISGAERDTSRRGSPWGILAVFKSDRLKDRLQQWSDADPSAQAQGKIPALTPEQIRASVLAMYERAQSCNKVPKPASNFFHLDENKEPTADDLPEKVPKPTSNKTPAQPKAKIFNEVVLATSMNSGLKNVHAADQSNQMFPIIDLHTNEPAEVVLHRLRASGSSPHIGLPGTLEGLQSNDTATTGHFTAPLEAAETGSITIELSKAPKQDLAGVSKAPELHNSMITSVNRDEQQKGDQSRPDGCAISDRSTLSPHEGLAGVSQGSELRQDGHPLSMDNQDDEDVSCLQTPFDQHRGDDILLDNQASNRLPKLLPAEPTVKRVTRTSKMPQKLTPHGGSMAVLRKKIIMNLLENCGGVMPGGKALEIPFTEQWQKRGHAGQPDTATIKAAINALFGAGQVRQSTFSFRNSRGNMIIKSMVLDVKLRDDDPKIQEVQDQIIECDPYSYIPKAIRPDDSRQAFVDSVQYTRQKLIEEDLTAKPRLQHKPLYQIRFEKRKQAAEDRAKKKVEKAESDRQLAERRQQKRWKLEAQRIKKLLAEIRSKYPKDRPMTATEQQETLEEYQAATEAWNFLSPTEESTKLPIPPPKIEGRTFGEFMFLALPNAIRRLSSDTLDLPGRLSTESIANAARPRKVERLATLNNPLPRPKIGSLVITSDVGELDVFKLHRASRNIPQNQDHQVERANEEFGDTNDRMVSDSGEEEQEQLTQPRLTPGPPKKPPWETLQLNSINPDRLTSFHGLSGLLKSSDFDSSDEFRSDVDDLLRWEVHYVELAYSFEDKPFVNHTMLHKHKLADNAVVDMNDALKEILGQAGRLIKRRVFPAPSQPPPHSVPLAAVIGEFGVFPAFSQPESQTPRFADVIEDVGYESSSTDTSPSTRSVSPEPEVYMEDALQPFEKLGLFQAPVDAPARIRFGQSRAPKGRKRKRQEDSSNAKLVATVRLHHNPQPAEGNAALDVPPSHQEDPQDDQSPRKKIKLRGPRKLKGLSKTNERRLLVAVIVIRTIAGGLDRNIDWKLVAKVFEPELSEIFIHGVWNRVRDRNKLQYQRLLSEFQETFPKAYEEGTVPALDFEHLEDYPWVWLIDWMLDVSDFPTQPTSTLEFPAQRSGIDNLFSLQATSDVTVAEFYSLDHGNTVPKRHAILNKQAYICPLTKLPELPFGDDDSRGLSIAKTWIRANITTPAATYRPDVARQKLSIFRTEVIERAIKDLLNTKILSGQRENRVVPGRNYDLSGFCIYCLDKTPSVATLHAAATFKLWLDEQFRIHGCVDMKTVTRDAQTLVLLDMFAHQRIKLQPKQLQANKWGLLDGHYETRKLDKSRMNFTISIAPTAGYIDGNPLLPMLTSYPPPASHLEEPQPARIPLWYDINDEVIPVLWELALAAVLSTVSVRPGLQVGEIERAVKPAMAAWEVEYVLEWGVKVGCVERVGMGWGLREWWWGALGGEEDLEEDLEEGDREVQDLKVVGESREEEELMVEDQANNEYMEVDTAVDGEVDGGTINEDGYIEMATSA